MTIFNAAQFKTAATRESIVLGNSEHPVADLVVSLMARPVPGRDDLWYIRTKSDSVTVTYRPSDRSLCVYEFGFEAFKQHVKDGTLPNIDVYDVPETDKWVGNAVNRILRQIYELA